MSDQEINGPPLCNQCMRLHYFNVTCGEAAAAQLPMPPLRDRLPHYSGVLLHKFWVIWYSLRACRSILRRALVHDASKLGRTESIYFAKANRLRDMEYGSLTYQANLKDCLGPALDHHYRNNPHHPEHFGNIDQMSPLDLIEMLADWKAAGRRHRTGSMEKSLDVNKARFEMEEGMEKGLRRDAYEIGLTEVKPK